MAGYFNPDPKLKRIKLNKKQWSELRNLVWELQHGLCADCGQYVPLDGDTIFNTAHLCHVKSKGSGGDDSRENTRICCFKCHILGEHGLKWSK
jgi:5-methylcytosine-specific restriction endonuclease McrA